jgi:hypothetical protein
MKKPQLTPSKLVHKDGIYWLPLSLLTTRIPNPFCEAIWSSCTLPLDPENVQYFAEAGQFESGPHNPLTDFSIDWHERRVAYLVSHIREQMTSNAWSDVSLSLKPLELELPIPSLNYWPDETMSDGFHRLSAALYLNLPGIWCMPGGSVFEVVEWVRTHNDPDFVARFERQFFDLHAEMDQETGLCC